MNREQLRAVIASSVGDPSVGSVAEVIDTIADALDLALHPRPSATQREAYADSIGYEPV